MGVAFACLKVAARTLQLLFLHGAFNPIGSTARRNRNHGALKAQRKLAPRASEARRNREEGALKAQLQSAQGSALGHATYPSFSAP